VLNCYKKLNFKLFINIYLYYFDQDLQDTKMIDFSNLLDYISSCIDTSHTFIYIGVGTHFHYFNNSVNKYEWDFRENQQFPPFLHDAKQKYFDAKILLILIDPAFKETSPYIVTSSNNFTEKSWNTSTIHQNLYVSDLGISTIIISQSITWGTYSEYEKESYNIENLMFQLCNLVSNPESRLLLFYHEFTGKNPILLEYLIKSKLDYDDNKICVDISRGANLSCYFNLTDPENYPVITIESDQLIYLNPIKIPDTKICKIYQEYSKFTWNQKSCQVSKTDTNYLIEKPDDMILCFQILKYDKISLDIVKDSIITMIRQFYTMIEKKNFGTKMWSVSSFPTIKSRFVLSVNHIQFIESKLEFMDSLNLLKKTDSDLKDYDLVFDEIKNNILTQLYDVLRIILISIYFKYNVISCDQINKFILDFQNIQDKYTIMNKYSEFIDGIL